jgi:hypothetical protein
MAAMAKGRRNLCAVIVANRQDARGGIRAVSPLKDQHADSYDLSESY